MVLRTKQNSDIEEISPKDDTCLQGKVETAMTIVSFIGASNSGKTTLLEIVIRELKLRGYRVAVIKRTHHDFEIDRPGKDSWRFARAGSDIVAIASASKMAFIDYAADELAFKQIEVLFGGKVDIVLTEGYKSEKAAKILVTGTEREPEPINCQGEILATVSAQSSRHEVLQFDLNDITRIVNLIMEQIDNNATKIKSA